MVGTKERWIGLPRAWRGVPVARASLDRVAIVGDIHGRWDLLEALLARLGDVPLVTVGDVGDRGLDTRGALDLLVERGALGVLGNHDLWLAAWAAGEGLAPLPGSTPTLHSYGVSPVGAERRGGSVHPAHRDWLLGLPVALDLQVAGEPWWVVHAGVPAAGWGQVAPDRAVPTLAREHPLELIWPKHDPEHAPILDRPVVCGHRPRKEPLDAGHVVAIDTGAGHGGRLTALLLPERTFVTVG
ncbi:MAG: metallophosphoesterase [Myxococcales bacterium]|nr:metallophosphoesterase [Myxococcales bacterium]